MFLKAFGFYRVTREYSFLVKVKKSLSQLKCSYKGSWTSFAPLQRCDQARPKCDWGVLIPETGRNWPWAALDGERRYRRVLRRQRDSASTRRRKREKLEGASPPMRLTLISSCARNVDANAERALDL